MAVGLVAVLWAVPACLYDEDDRCGPGQHLGPLGSCLCDDQLVQRDRDCVPCGDAELWQNGSCVCIEGYSRAADGTCQEGGAGLRCDPSLDDAMSCFDPKFSLCRALSDEVGYCTTDCGDDEDCPRGFVCDTSMSPATCMTSAVGQGEPCESDQDCADKDATYCELQQAQACLVQGCSTSDPLTCSEGWTCCDLADLGLAKTLCVPEGMCPTAP